VSKQWKPGKQTVELRPSRIRREPVRPQAPVKAISPEREIWMTVFGVALFAIVSAAIIFGFSEITSHRASDKAEQADDARFGQCYNHMGPNCVIDGDTAYIAGEKVEIAGMNSPGIVGANCDAERSRGIAAAVQLVEILNGGTVTLGGSVHGRDGRMLRSVSVDGRDVGRAMVAAGVVRDPDQGPTSDWCA
jgi:micrococcal nuclease